VLKTQTCAPHTLRYGNASKNATGHSRTALKYDRCPSTVTPRSIFAEARTKIPSSLCYMQIFANLLRWLAGSGARRAHVKRADDLLKKLSRSLSSK
jgi:hypothetical protein